MLKAAAVVIGLAVLTIAMTWPLLSPSAAVLPDSDDAYFSVWRVAWVAHQWPGPLPRAAGWLFLAGTLVFSGSLYTLVLTGQRWLGAVTPLGGVTFLAGWTCLALAAMRARA